MFFTTLLIDVTPLEYNELNAGVRSHKTEDEWPQKCTVVINTGFTKKKKKIKIQNNSLPEELRKQKREGEHPYFVNSSDTHKDHTRPVDYYSQIADGVNEMYHQQKMGFVMTYDVFLWRMYRCYDPLVKQFTNVYVQAFLSGSTASAPNAISHRTTCRRFPWDRNEPLGWGWSRRVTLVNDDSAYPKASNSQGEFFKHRVQKGRPDNSETVHMC